MDYLELIFKIVLGAIVLVVAFFAIFYLIAFLARAIPVIVVGFIILCLIRSWQKDDSG